MELTNAGLMYRVHSLEFDYPTAMIAVFDTVGIYIYASPSHFLLLGYDPGELIGRSLFDFVAPADIPHIMLARDDSALFSSSTEIGVGLIKKSGKLLNVRSRSLHHLDLSTGDEFFIGWTIPVVLTNRV